MKTKFRNIIGTVLITTAIFAHPSHAGIGQPSGITVVTVPAGLGRTEIFGMPFARPVEFSGVINGVTSSGGNATFTVSLDAGQSVLPAFNNTSQNADAWYLLEILDGPAIGFLLPCTGNVGDTSITVEGDTGTISVSSGSKFCIRKEWTLTTLFGVATTANKLGYGNSSSAATVNGWVQVYNVATGTLITYYVNEAGTTTKTYNWKASTSTTSRNHVPLRLGRGMMLVNRKPSELNFPVSGEYRVARTRLSVPAGKLSFLANPGPTDVTFDDATIPANSPTRASGNPSTSSGDTWQMWNPVLRTFTSYRVGGTANVNGPSMYTAANARVIPTIPAFKAVGVKPVGTSGNVVVTIAPKI